MTASLHQVQDHLSLNGRLPQGIPGELFAALPTGSSLYSDSDSDDSSIGAVEGGSTRDSNEWEDVDVTEEGEGKSKGKSRTSLDVSRPSEESHANTSTYEEDLHFGLPIARFTPADVNFDETNRRGNLDAIIEAERRADDISRIVHLLEQKMMEDDLINLGLTITDRAQRQLNEAEIHNFRVHKPDAFHHAIIQVARNHSGRTSGTSTLPPPKVIEGPAEGLKQWIPLLSRPNVIPIRHTSSYENIIEAAQNQTTADGTLQSSATGLTVITPDLRKSRSRRIFTPIRDTPSPSLPTRPAEAWTPLPSGSPDPVGDPGAMELVETPRGGRMAAISSQTKLHVLKLQDTAPPIHRPGSRMSRGWRSEVHTGACDHDCGHMLLNPTLARQNPMMLKEQKQISAKILYFCFMCPPLAIAFGFGYLDWLARRKSNGRVMQMAQVQKKRALCAALPTSLLIWGFVATVIAIAVVLLHR